MHWAQWREQGRVIVIGGGCVGGGGDDRAGAGAGARAAAAGALSAAGVLLGAAAVIALVVEAGLSAARSAVAAEGTTAFSLGAELLLPPPGWIAATTLLFRTWTRRPVGLLPPQVPPLSSVNALADRSTIGSEAAAAQLSQMYSGPSENWNCLPDSSKMTTLPARQAVAPVCHACMGQTYSLPHHSERSPETLVTSMATIRLVPS